jgi:uncharacterized protein YukE
MKPIVRADVEQVFLQELRQMQRPESVEQTRVSPSEAAAIVKETMDAHATVGEIEALITDQQDPAVEASLEQAFKQYVKRELDQSIGAMGLEDFRILAGDPKLQLAERTKLFIEALDLEQGGYSSEELRSSASRLKKATVDLKNALQAGVSPDDKSKAASAYSAAYDSYKKNVNQIADAWRRQAKGVAI